MTRPAHIAEPIAGPAWLPSYTRNIERLFGQHVATGGGVTLGYSGLTADGTLGPDDFFVAVDATAGDVTVTLPAASGSQGRTLVIKKTDSTTNLVIIDGNGSETIDDATTQSIAAQYVSVMLICDGSEWWIC